MPKLKASHPEYTGPIGIKCAMPSWAVKAYRSLCAQRSRCNTKSDTSYQWYGGKGVRVKYDSRAFVGWWLVEMKKFPVGTNLVCSRKDHDGHYSFENVKLEKRGDNISEANSRTHKRPVKCFFRASGVFICVFESLEDAALKTGVSMSYISTSLSGRNKLASRRKVPLRFEYV